MFDSKKKVKLTNAEGVEHKLVKKQLQAIDLNKALLAMYTNQVRPCAHAAPPLQLLQLLQPPAGSQLFDPSSLLPPAGRPVPETRVRPSVAGADPPAARPHPGGPAVPREAAPQGHRAPAGRRTAATRWWKNLRS